MAFLGQYSPNTYRANNIFTASAGQTVFSAVYDPGCVDVYRNGVKLVNGQDYSASNGNSVTLVSAASVTDVIEVVSFKVNLAIKDFSGAPIAIGANTTLVQGQQYYLTASGLTVSLPTSPLAGWAVRVFDVSGSVTNQVSGNGANIQASSSNLTIDIANTTVTFVYVDAIRGWLVI
jgi:hypothetical protein